MENFIFSPVTSAPTNQMQFDSSQGSKEIYIDTPKSFKSTFWKSLRLKLVGIAGVFVLCLL